MLDRLVDTSYSFYVVHKNEPAHLYSHPTKEAHQAPQDSVQRKAPRESMAHLQPHSRHSKPEYSLTFMTHADPSWPTEIDSKYLKGSAFQEFGSFGLSVDLLLFYAEAILAD